MNSRIRTTSILAWTASAIILGYGCSRDQSNGTSVVADSAHFEPAPAPNERSSVEARLKRYHGQREFLNPAGYYGGPMVARAASAESAEGGTSARAIQESDVFKVGKPGSKLLFLLNNYRGLQVVSFEKGADQPELLGRVEATGNTPDTMYYDISKDRLVVVERVYTDDEGNQRNWQEQLSRIIVYDVTNPSQPFISEKIEFKGNAADSRLVGDVLYVATSYRPNNRYGEDANKPQGIVYSFKLGSQIEKVAQKTLALPTYRENMNIVEVANPNGGFNYYLLAVLSNSRWGWWFDRSSAVEIIDITSPSGAIEPVMIAPVKGQINERSSTSIKNNTLIVVSNYVSDEGRRLQRIAVETYKFPKDKRDILSSDEVKFRKMYIERELKKLENAGATPEALKAKRLELESDELLGTKGKFELTAAGNKEKIMADSTVTVGDTNGQHASLQDVRFAGDLLYAFWVPANMIDPLDVFDISNPENGITHKGHLEFEGWIQRSFPLEFNNRTFVLGLGTIVPSVNNESGRRHPQARLIELKKLRNGNLKAVDTADITFKDSNIWAQLNGEDKFVELNMTNAEAGQGTILFRVDQWSDGKYTSGGKLVAFDLSAADDGDVFTEGGLLASEWGWLKRVFTNSEISKINTFSDEQLQVFNTETAGSASEIFAAIGTLELARNVVAYVSLNVDTSVQIISRGSDHYWSEAPSTATTMLRQVSPLKGDSELSDVLAELSVKGEYESHLKLRDTLLVSSRETKQVERVVEGETQKIQVAVHNLNLFSVAEGKLVQMASNSIEVEASANTGGFGIERMWWNPWSSHSKLSLNMMADGSIVATVGKNLFEIRLDAAAVVETLKIATQTCELENSTRAELSVKAGRLYMEWARMINEEGEVVSAQVSNSVARGRRQNEAPFEARYLAVLNPVLGAAQPTFACAVPVNVPGELFATTANGLVLTKDNRLLDRVRKEERNSNGEAYVYYETLTKTVLASLRPVSGDQVELVDMYDPTGDGENRWSSSIDNMKSVNDDRFMFIESKSYDSQDDRYTFSVLSFDESGRILKQSSLVEMELGGNAYLTQVIPGNDGLLSLVQSGRRLQILKWDAALKRPVAQQMQRMMANGEFAKAAPVVVLPGYSWYGYGDRTDVDFDSSRALLNFPQGLHGVAQVKLVSQ